MSLDVLKPSVIDRRYRSIRPFGHRLPDFEGAQKPLDPNKFMKKRGFSQELGVFIIARDKEQAIEIKQVNWIAFWRGVMKKMIRKNEGITLWFAENKGDKKVT